MLDPDTGDIELVSPEQSGDNTATAASANQKARRHSGHGAQKTDSTGQSTANDSSTGADEPVVHCPDGSLRMGHANRSDGDSADASDKLCANR